MFVRTMGRVRLTGNTSKSFERAHVANDNVSAHHDLGSCGHGDRENKNQGDGKSTKSGGYCVDDNITLAGELDSRFC